MYIASKALFSSNSVALLDHLAPTNGINMYLSTFKDWLVINNLDSSCFCVGGSAILALCGLRECNDLDLLYLGNPSDLPPLPEGISLHLSQESFYPYTFSEIIHDHNLHCFYLGLKFAIPQVIYSYKMCRSEQKDLSDLALMSQYFHFSLPFYFKFRTLTLKILSPFFKFFFETKYLLYKCYRRISKHG